MCVARLWLIWKKKNLELIIETLVSYAYVHYRFICCFRMDPWNLNLYFLLVLKNKYWLSLRIIRSHLVDLKVTRLYFFLPCLLVTGNGSITSQQRCAIRIPVNNSFLFNASWFIKQTSESTKPKVSSHSRLIRHLFKIIQ